MEDKYKELFEYAKEVYKEELARFTRIDEKASKYLSILTLILGGFGYFGIWVIDNILPPQNILEWVLLINLILLFASLIAAWFFNFRALRLHSLQKMPLDNETIEFFNDNKSIDIYFAMTKGLSETNSRNKNETDKKSKNLYRNYISTIISVILLIIFTFIFSIYKWDYNYHNKVEVQMSSDKKTSQPKPSKPEPKPNPEVKPPKFQMVTEGYIPDISKGRDTIKGTPKPPVNKGKK